MSAGDTRDAAGRPTFLPFPPEELLDESQSTSGVLADKASWYWKTVWWPHSVVRTLFSL